FKDLVKERIDYDSLYFHHLEAERFSKGVSDFLEEYPISLMILIRYKKVFLRTLLWANNTQELRYHTTVPMLVYIPAALYDVSNKLKSGIQKLPVMHIPLCFLH